MKEELQEVTKVWGKELWVVNRPEYCGKFLYLDKGAVSSYHKHVNKIETFFSLHGVAALTIEGKDYMLTPFARPKTVLPGQLHSFTGISDTLILEISTHHEDSDIVRMTLSKAASP